MFFYNKLESCKLIFIAMNGFMTYLVDGLQNLISYILRVVLQPSRYISINILDIANIFITVTNFANHLTM